MSGPGKPRVLLFDIGGVCVVSPFQAILDYEQENSIPPGYINFAISKTSPNGTWHRLERGEIPLDENYYRAFKADLEQPARWRDYHERLHSQAKRQSTATTTTTTTTTTPSSPPPVPPVPSIDAEKLFLTMMTNSRTPDPFMYPALQKLKASGEFKLAALSNNVTFPAGHVLAQPTAVDIKGLFAIFIGSAEVGMRKPEPRIYALALARLRSAWGRDIQPADVVFLDDIGENLKAARAVGFRTVKVTLGRTETAVRELESLTGLSLLDHHHDREGEEQGRNAMKPRL